MSNCTFENLVVYHLLYVLENHAALSCIATMNKPTCIGACILPRTSTLLGCWHAAQADRNCGVCVPVAVRFIPQPEDYVDRVPAVVRQWMVRSASVPASMLRVLPQWRQILRCGGDGHCCLQRRIEYACGLQVCCNTPFLDAIISHSIDSG